MTSAASMTDSARPAPPCRRDQTNAARRAEMTAHASNASPEVVPPATDSTPVTTPHPPRLIRDRREIGDPQLRGVVGRLPAEGPRLRGSWTDRRVYPPSVTACNAETTAGY